MPSRAATLEQVMGKLYAIEDIARSLRNSMQGPLRPELSTTDVETIRKTVDDISLQTATALDAVQELPRRARPE